MSRTEENQNRNLSTHTPRFIAQPKKPKFRVLFEISEKIEIHWLEKVEFPKHTDQQKLENSELAYLKSQQITYHAKLFAHIVSRKKTDQ